MAMHQTAVLDKQFIQTANWHWQRTNYKTPQLYSFPQGLDDRAMSSLFRKLALRNSASSQETVDVAEQHSIRQPYAPKPLPARRKRALTHPLLECNSRQWTSDQVHCALLQMLPYDIRRLVYEIVFTGRVFHIIRLRRRLRHVECNDCGGKQQQTTCWGIAAVDNKSVQDLESEGFGRGVLDLLRTCRQIYTEGIDLLYSLNTFDVMGPESLVSFSTIILPQRLNALGSLQLTWAFFKTQVTDSEKVLLQGDDALWKACWRVIASMEGLRDLRVWLSMSPTNKLARHLETALLAPLAQVGTRRLFEIRVSWSLTENRNVSEEVFANYRLVRQEDEDWGAYTLRLQND